MLKGLWEAAKSSPAVSLTMVGGAIAGGVGGAMLGGTGAGAVLAALGLGAVGLIGGSFLGSFINKQIDKSTPAPMGVRVVDAPKAEPGKAVKLSFKPSAVTTEQAITQLREKLKDDNSPEATQLRGAIPMLSHLAATSTIELDGTASADGSSVAVSSASVNVPGMAEPVKFSVRGVSLPLKDGVLDESNPEAKAKFREILIQGVQQKVPGKYRKIAEEAVDTMLSKANMPVEQVAQLPSQEQMLQTGLTIAKNTMAAPGAVPPGVNPNAGLPFGRGGNNGPMVS